MVNKILTGEIEAGAKRRLADEYDAAHSVTHLVKEAQGRYSPAAVVAVSRELVSGAPEQSPWAVVYWVFFDRFDLRRSVRCHKLATAA
jgi:hypothetical protein